MSAPLPKQPATAPAPVDPARLSPEREIAALRLVVALGPHLGAIRAVIPALHGLPAAAVADDPELTTTTGARLCRRSEETVRRWCDDGRLGRWDPVDRKWKFRRGELIALLIKRHGRDRLPAGLWNFVG